MKLGRLGYLPQTPSSSLVALAGLKFGVIFPISSGLPLTYCPLSCLGALPLPQGLRRSLFLPVSPAGAKGPVLQRTGLERWGPRS